MTGYVLDDGFVSILEVLCWRGKKYREPEGYFSAESKMLMVQEE